MEAGEHTQRTVAELSRQLRRFLDDQVWLENPRITEILHGIEAKVVALCDTQPAGEVMSIAAAAADIELPMERPLHTPTLKPKIADIALADGADDIDAAALFSQVVIDKAQLARHIRHALQDKSQITLAELCRSRPLQHGLAELVAYLQLGGDSFKTTVDEGAEDLIVWQTQAEDGREFSRQARLPRVIFVR